MGRLTGALRITGTLDNIIFYQRGNKTYCRTKPASRKPSKTSQQCATDFGRASSYGKLIRTAMEGLWPIADDEMNFRLNKAIYAAMRKDTEHANGEKTVNIEALKNELRYFRFNNKSGSPLMPQVQMDDAGHVTMILGQNWQDMLKPPRGVTHIELMCAAIAVNFEKGKWYKETDAAYFLKLAKNMAPLSLQMRLLRKKGYMVLTVLQYRDLAEFNKADVSVSENRKHLHFHVIATF